MPRHDFLVQRLGDARQLARVLVLVEEAEAEALLVLRHAHADERVRLQVTDRVDARREQRVGRVEVRAVVELRDVAQDRRRLRQDHRLAIALDLQRWHLAELQPARRLQRVELRAVREAMVLEGDAGMCQGQSYGFRLAREVEVEELVGGGVFSFSLRHPCRVLCAALHGGVYAVQPLRCAVLCCVCCAVLAVLCSPAASAPIRYSHWPRVYVEL
mmetsp:Transcript_15324/g.40442  ORF Transcript_15324/g.40442 Transcript_15324/m.40442 type:complete len:215 (+) Transcript_15324:224-868(+)